MQGFMALQQADIVAIEQPADLLVGQRHELISWTWPLELRIGQRLVIEDKTVVLPHQALDLVALPVGEGMQGNSEGALAHFLINQYRLPLVCLRKSMEWRYKWISRMDRVPERDEDTGASSELP